MQIQPAKGTREYPPEEKIIRDQIVQTLVAIFERYGFSPLETPTLQRYDFLAAKYAGGSEILKETFKLTDQGGRELALRYDLTVPLALSIGANPMIKLPFKRYEVGKVYRDGPIKTGRLREFWQCDVDVVGTKAVLADAELLLLTLDAFAALGIPVRIELNNRKVLDGLMESLNVPENKRFDVITAIDKLKKVPIKDIEQELAEKGIRKEQVDTLLRTFKVAGNNKEKIAALRKVMKSAVGEEGLQEIEQILAVAGKDIEFSPALARGLAYYTGPVFEAFLQKGEFSSSLAAGGRYDKMIGDFLGGKREFPATGISFGLEPIGVVLAQAEQRRSVAELYVVPIGEEQAALTIAQQFRTSGIKVDIDLAGKGPSKNLDYARVCGIPYVLFIGADEVQTGKYTLREMAAGKETKLPLKEIEKKLK